MNTSTSHSGPTIIALRQVAAVLGLAMAAAVVMPTAAAAEPGLTGDSPPKQYTGTFNGQSGVRDETLSRVRGGYAVGSTLEITFGIERSVVMGGAAASSTTLNVTSNGLGSVLPAMSSVIQNAVDGQKIMAVTTIDITANSLQLLKLGNVQTLVGYSIPAIVQR